METVISKMPGLQMITHLGPGIFAAFSQRTFDKARCPQIFEHALLKGKTFYSGKQVHGKRVWPIKADTLPEAYEADALVTDRSDVILGVRTADCIPAFFTAEHAACVGIAHAGWRGLKAGVLTETVKTLRDLWNVSPDSIRVVLGPYMGRCCYEVGPEFKGYFDSGHLTVKNQRLFLDMGRIAFEELRDAGIAENKITDLRICNSCENQNYFSARRDKSEERILSVICLNK